jgi:hypothetical protein
MLATLPCCPADSHVRVLLFFSSACSGRWLTDIPYVLHYGLIYHVGGWTFDKHFYFDFDSHKCPPWDLAVDRPKGGIFPPPPGPKQLERRVGVSAVLGCPPAGRGVDGCIKMYAGSRYMYTWHKLADVSKLGPRLGSGSRQPQGPSSWSARCVLLWMRLCMVTSCVCDADRQHISCACLGQPQR